MYRELATIKDKDKVTGFVVYDGTSVSIMDMEQAKKEAARGNIDTLGYENGKFIPIIQGELAKELKKKFLLKKYKKIYSNMTFADFVNNDCIFRQQDIDLMTGDMDNHIVLANICNAFEVKAANTTNWMLTAAFWSPNTKDMERVKLKLMFYGIKISKDYGNFIMLNLPLRNPRTDFDILTFQQAADVNLLYNLDIIKTMDKRVDFAIQCFPRFYQKIMNKARPSEMGLRVLDSVLTVANRLSLK